MCVVGGGYHWIKVVKQVVNKGFEGKNKDKTTEFSAEGLLQGTKTLNKQGRKEESRVSNLAPFAAFSTFQISFILFHFTFTLSCFFPLSYP